MSIKRQNTLSRLFFLGLISVCLFLYACETPPDYPSVPSIEFQSVQYFDNNGAQSDTILIKITFRDGDGDLGLTGQDTTPPFNFLQLGARTNVSGDTLEILTNLNHYNFFCDFYIKRQGVFERMLDFNLDDGIPYQVPVNPFYFRFPLLNPDMKKGPLEGTIQIALANSFFQRFDGFGTFLPTDTLKLRIYIKDRTLNNSNTIESTEFTVPPYQ